MAVESNPSNDELAAVFDAYDAFVDSVVHHLDRLEAEKPTADASGDPRYVHRVDRGIEWSNALLNTLDEHVLERLFGLRHNAHQLGYAREGKIV